MLAFGRQQCNFDQSTVAQLQSLLCLGHAFRLNRRASETCSMILRSSRSHLLQYRRSGNSTDNKDWNVEIVLEHETHIHAKTQLLGLQFPRLFQASPTYQRYIKPELFPTPEDISLQSLKVYEMSESGLRRLMHRQMSCNSVRVLSFTRTCLDEALPLALTIFNFALKPNLM